MKVSLSYISIHNLDDDVVDVIVAVLTDGEYQPLSLNRLELGGDLEHARARVNWGILVETRAIVDYAGVGAGGPAAGAVATDDVAVRLDEEVERAVAVAAVAHDLDLASGKGARKDGSRSVARCESGALLIRLANPLARGGL